MHLSFLELIHICFALTRCLLQSNPLSKPVKEGKSCVSSVNFLVRHITVSRTVFAKLASGWLHYPQHLLNIHVVKDDTCPARGNTCNECGKKDHFEICCKSGSREKKSENEVTEVKTDEVEYAFELENAESQVDTVTLDVGGVMLMDTMIDSSALCNCIDELTWSSLNQEGIACKSEKSQKLLFSYGTTEPINVLGFFTCNIACQETGLSCTDGFTVIASSGRSLLKKKTTLKLNVLHVGPPSEGYLYTVAKEGVEGDIRQRYEHMLNGVGKYTAKTCHLHQDESVPGVVEKTWSLPFSLRPIVDRMLDEMLDLDIIKSVNGIPTKWVSPMVVVPNGLDEARICIDMRQANTAIICERHPMPTIDEVLYELYVCTVFSKLDMKWEFHQIELDEESRGITTFTTRHGLYRYKRSMYGVASAPEIYQNIVWNTLAGNPHTANIADDCIIGGVGMEDHDRNVFGALDKLSTAGFTLNGKKCKFCMQDLRSFAMTSARGSLVPSEEKVAAIVNAGTPKDAAEVRSFLNLVQYSSKFLPHYALVAEPLRELTRKNVKFRWGVKQRAEGNDYWKTYSSILQEWL